MSALIATHNLSKRYPGPKIDALHKLNLSVAAGEVYGFLGANGAGKSTAIRTLLNFIQPTGGSATILGKDITRESVAIRREVGYLAGDVALYNDLTGRQFLKYMAALQPLKNPDYLKRLLQVLDADDSKLISDMSKGTRQKFGLIQALMHEPQVLILDEPTSGLDPLMQEIFFGLMKEAKDRGAAILASSHNLNEVQRMADRVGFIREGKMVAEQSIAELQKSAAQSFDVTFKGPPPLDGLKRVPGASVNAVSPDRVVVHLQGSLKPLLSLLAAQPVLRIDKPSVNLEEEFLKFYQHKDEAGS